MKSGFIAVIGAPNVGKSSFVNLMVGKKVTIVSPRPQTTRDRLFGVAHWKETDTQVVFVDTPGIFKPKIALDKYMVGSATQSLDGVEGILFMIDAAKGFTEKDRDAWQRIKPDPEKTIIVINKTDLVKNKNELLEMISLASNETGIKTIFPISVLKLTQTDELKRYICDILPDGPAFFPADMLTDKDRRYIIRELIREAVIFNVFDELPYMIAVLIEELQGAHIRATLICERESQKGILIGSQGTMIKNIGIAARKKIEHMFGSTVFLELTVQVEKNWRKNDRILKELGYEQ